MFMQSMAGHKPRMIDAAVTLPRIKSGHFPEALSSTVSDPRCGRDKVEIVSRN